MCTYITGERDLMITTLLVRKKNITNDVMNENVFPQRFIV